MIHTKTNIIKRFWMYFRSGHGMYLAYSLNLSTFILVFYRLLIEQIPIFENIFPTLEGFIIIFIPIYLSLAIILGRHHYKFQMETDMVEASRRNPYIKQVVADLILIKKKLEIKE